jgi:polar amino acid transport system permease protein
MNSLWHYITFIGSGLKLTCFLTLGSMSLSLILGGCFAFLRYNALGICFIKGFVSLVRGTPSILQLSVMYFLIPNMTGISLSLTTAGILALGINSSVYVSEIFRSGLENLPKEQFEAAQTLQIPSYFLWKDIIGPQIFRNILPALINEIITVTKDTSLISTLGGMDLMRRGQMIAAEEFIYFLPLGIVAGYYYILTFVIEIFGKFLEKKYNFLK